MQKIVNAEPIIKKAQFDKDFKTFKKHKKNLAKMNQYDIDKI